MAHLLPLRAMKKLAVESFDRPAPEWNHSQLAALATLQERAWIYKTRLALGNFSMLQEIIQLFGDIFFLGLMDDLEVEPCTSREMPGKLGQTVMFPKPHQGRSVVDVKIQIGSDVQGPWGSGENVMGTILHECVHLPHDLHGQL